MNVVKLRTAELSGIALDWAIARLTRTEGQVRVFRHGIDGNKGYVEVHQFGSTWSRYDPSTTLQGNTLIDEHRIGTAPMSADVWAAFGDVFGDSVVAKKAEAKGPTRLIAAMRCICLIRYGEEIEVPTTVAPMPAHELKLVEMPTQVATFAYVRTHLPSGREDTCDFQPMQDSAFGDIDMVPPAVLRAKAESLISKWNREQRDTYSYRLVLNIPTLTDRA